MPMIKWLSVTDRFTKMYLDRQFIPLGINSSQHMYILKICQYPGITQDQFISSFHLNPSNITRSILTLEKKGFLVRKTNPADKRTCMLYPTSKAEAICGPIQKIIEQWENQILQNFCDEEQQIFCRCSGRSERLLCSYITSNPRRKNRILFRMHRSTARERNRKL